MRSVQSSRNVTLPDATSKRAIFLDRDGTVIEDMKYSVEPDRLRLLPRALLGLRQLQDAGYLLVFVTNQSGVARGYFDEDSLRSFNAHFVHWLGEMGVQVSGMYY